MNLWLKTKTYFLHSLGIKPTEKKIVFWSCTLSFLIGSVQCYLSAVPISLFLIYFSSSALPQLYLIVSVVAMILGIIYSFFEHRLPFTRLIFSIILIMGCITTLFWFLLEGVSSPWIIATLTLWAIVAYDFLDFGLWSVLNLIYNLQQGKRLFGIIGASQSIGGIISGLLLPVLLIFFATIQIVLFTGILIFAALLILIELLKLHREPLVEEDDESPGEISECTFSTLWHNNYILKLMCMIILGVFSMYIADLLFNTVAAQRYPDEKSLAGFFGIIFSLVDGLDLLFSTFLFSWILRRYGLIISLMLLPVIGSIICVLLQMSYLPFIAFSFIFGLVVLLKLFEEAIRASVSEMSHLLLLQPLSPGLRTFVLSKSDIIIVPLATAVISLILLGITKNFGIVIPWLAFAALICFVLCVLITLTLKSDYIKILTTAIANRYEFSIGFNQLSKESLPFFRQALLNSHPDEIIYALSTIEQIDMKEFLKELQIAFNSDVVEIRQYILKKVRQYRVMALFHETMSLIDVETNNELRAQAIRTAAELNYDRARTKIKILVNDKSHLVCRAAFISMWCYGNSSEKQEALDGLNSMCVSTEETVRQSAAYIIGELNDSQINEKLATLLQDPSTLVLQETLHAIIKTSQVACFNELLTNLHLIQLTGDILSRFLELGNLLMPIVQKNFSNFSLPNKLKLLSLMSRMHIETANVFLEHSILANHGVLKQVALGALVKSKAYVSPMFHAKLNEQINEEVGYLKQQQVYLKNTPVNQITQLLRDVLSRKMTLSIERLLLYFAIYYHDKPVNKVKIGLELGNANDISYALELLEKIVNLNHKKTALPILYRIYLSETELESQNKFVSMDFQTLIKEHLHTKDQEYVTILSCIACLYIIKMMGREPFESEIETLRHSESTIIQETLSWLDEIPKDTETFK